MIQIQIEKDTYNIPTTQADVSIGQFFSFLTISEEYEKWNEETFLPNGLEAQSDDLVKELTYVAEMVLAVTNIPKDVLYSLPPQSILQLHNIISFEPVPYEFEGSFVWRGCTEKELQEKQERLRILKKQTGFIGRYLSKEVSSLTKEIKQLQSTTWNVTKDLGNDTFEQFVITDAIAKQVRQSSEKARAGYYKEVPRIIAHLARKEGEKYNSTIAEKRASLFAELPLHIADSIARFFFIHLKNYTHNNTKTFSRVKMAK